MPSIDCSDIGQRVVMVYSMPRTTWTANMRCAMDVATALGIGMREYGSAFWSLSLENVLAKVLDGPYEFALTVDYDSVFTPHNVLHLYALMKANPDFDALAAMQAKRCSPAILLARKDESGQIPETISASELAGEVFKASQAHFGLTMIRLSSLKAMPRPWFLRVADPEKPGQSIDDDVYFWHQWEKAGKTLFVDCHNGIGHIEESITWVGKSTERIVQRWQEYVAQGRPLEARGIDEHVQNAKAG